MDFWGSPPSFKVTNLQRIRACAKKLKKKKAKLTKSLDSQSTRIPIAFYCGFLPSTTSFHMVNEFFKIKLLLRAHFGSVWFYGVPSGEEAFWPEFIHMVKPCKIKCDSTISQCTQDSWICNPLPDWNFSPVSVLFFSQYSTILHL